jgi:hypothetical protein
MIMAGRRPLFVALVVVLFCMTSPALACPWCDGGQPGINQVKAAIFNEGFWMRAAAVLAPFPVLAGIVAFIYFGPPKTGSSNQGEQGGSRVGNQP